MPLNKPILAEPTTLRNFCGVATLLYTTKTSPLCWSGDGALAVEKTKCHWHLSFKYRV